MRGAPHDIEEATHKHEAAMRKTQAASMALPLIVLTATAFITGAELPLDVFSTVKLQNQTGEWTQAKVLESLGGCVREGFALHEGVGFTGLSPRQLKFNIFHKRSKRK